MRHGELLIGGVFYGGPCDQGIGKEPVRNPYNGQFIGSVAEAGWAEVDAALDAATTSYETWRNSSIRDRQSLLRQISAKCRQQKQELAELLCLEIGKPIAMAEAEVERTAITFELAADALTAPTGQVLPTSFDGRGDDCRILVERFPLGPILAITPYNWPYNLAAQKLAPAVATGNTVVVKAPMLAPLSTLRLGRLIHEAGAPDGVVNFLHCANDLGERAALDDRIKMVSFTGSERVGWMLKEKLWAKRTVLELGGDASAVIMPDTDLGWAIPRITSGGYGYAGQICISVQNVWIHGSRWDEAVEALIEGTNACQAGDPSVPGTVCGPLITDDAAARVVEQIAGAEDGGANVVAGGHRVGNLIHPMLITKTDGVGPILADEIFGPVLFAKPFSDPIEVIEAINRGRFGIQAGIFTNDLRVADQFYRELNVSGVIINDVPTLRFDNMPYGGQKRSGVGREGVMSSMLEMTDPKVMVTRLH